MSGSHDHRCEHVHSKDAYRHDPTQPDHRNEVAPTAACCSAGSCTSVSGSADRASRPGVAVTILSVAAMDCPTEEALIRTKLGAIAGVDALNFNLMQRVLTVSHEPAVLDDVLAAIRALGFTATVATAETIGMPEPMEAVPKPHKPWWPLALAGVAAVGAEGAEWFQLATPWLPALLAIAAVAVGGLSTYKKGWVALRNGQLNINALMSIAVTGALVLQQWPEAAMVMVLYAAAERVKGMFQRMSIEVRKNLSGTLATIKQLGTLKSLNFMTVNGNGADVYDVVFEHGRVMWFISPLTADGKVAARGFQRLN